MTSCKWASPGLGKKQVCRTLEAEDPFVSQAIHLYRDRTSKACATALKSLEKHTTHQFLCSNKALEAILSSLSQTTISAVLSNLVAMFYYKSAGLRAVQVVHILLQLSGLSIL